MMWLTYRDSELTGSLVDVAAVPVIQCVPAQAAKNKLVFHGVNPVMRSAPGCMHNIALHVNVPSSFGTAENDVERQ